MTSNIVAIQPIALSADDLKTVQQLDPPTVQQVALFLDLAERFGYSRESEVFGRPPFTDRIRLNDPEGLGYHWDYLVQLVDA